TTKFNEVSEKITSYDCIDVCVRISCVILIWMASTYRLLPRKCNSYPSTKDALPEK
ncbi:hypothetical protein WA026_017138, partial [Henosepilachna vigintioctopunctata]